ncbi:MAG TPA: hypothetical protein VJP86_15875 [Vicinamibacterales bacterium]|nr:hypothetical protein [Vicinamibacterales bacterium]
MFGDVVANLRKLASPLLFAAASTVWTTAAHAQTITLTGGNLELQGSNAFATGRLLLSGDRGFMFRGGVNSLGGFFGPTISCVHCTPGTVINLAAHWSGNDLPGDGTLDGQTYTHFGGFSSFDPQMEVQFDGSLTLPPLSDSATVSGRFTFRATFQHQGGPTTVVNETLFGGGVATLFLTRDLVFGDSWTMNRFVYAFDSAVPYPWISTDVGSFGTAGDAFTSSGGFTIAGAGSDIWGPEDSFRYTAQLLSGNGEIVARVVSEQDTHPFAKAGVMFRSAFDKASAHTVIDVKPDGFVEFMSRPAPGANTDFLGGVQASFPVWLKLRRSGSQVTGLVSTDGVTYTTIGSTSVTFSSMDTIFAGLAVTSHDPAALNQAMFDGVSVAPATVGLSAPWKQTDIDGVGLPGDASIVNGTFSVSGAGADIWGAEDSFHFVYQPIFSEGSIVARVTSIQNTNPFAKAGIMMRTSLGSDAANVMLNVRPNGAIEFLARTSQGASTQFVGGGTIVALPALLQLTRVSAQLQSLFIASIWDDESESWIQIGSVVIDMLPDAFVGLAVTSHDTSKLNTSTFDEVSVRRNLLEKGGFEQYVPPALGAPGWVSDDGVRQAPAVSSAANPHTGQKHGLCSVSTNADCGMFQNVVAPGSGMYTLSYFATADRSGGLVGVDVNGSFVASLPVEARGAGNYGASPSSLTFFAAATDVIHVWMYSPPTPGFVAIDDVTLIPEAP